MPEKIHIYTSPLQPATRFIDEAGGKRFVFKCNPRALRRCWNCGRLRWAKNLQVQVFYDSTRYFCRDKADRHPSRKNRKK